MWSDCSDETYDFKECNKTERSDIESKTGTQFVTTLNIFSFWILSQPKTIYYGKKKLCWSP